MIVTKTRDAFQKYYVIPGHKYSTISGNIAFFGDKVDRSSGDLKIEDRVVVHPGDPAPATNYLRDTEYRVVSDISYLVPISSNVPMKLAALLGGRGLSIFKVVQQIKSHLTETNNNR